MDQRASKTSSVVEVTVTNIPADYGRASITNSPKIIRRGGIIAADHFRFAPKRIPSLPV
jgi:hypothetical protein